MSDEKYSKDDNKLKNKRLELSVWFGTNKPVELDETSEENQLGDQTLLVCNVSFCFVSFSSISLYEVNATHNTEKVSERVAKKS